MAKPNIAIIDVTTNELITREMNNEEYAQHLLDKESEELKLAEAQAAAEAKKAAKAQALAALGLSQEVVNLLAE
jgi:hypothetical protein